MDFVPTGLKLKINKLWKKKISLKEMGLFC